jgi:glutathione S-transferase
MAELVLTTFDWVPELPRGYVRDIRVRWALEEAGLSYRVASVPFEKRNAEHFAHQPFGQVPWLTDGDISVFESGAILLHLAERSAALMPTDPHGRSDVKEWLFAALNSVEMGRTWRHPGSHGRIPRTSSGQFLRDLLRTDRRAHLEEQTMGLAELTLSGGFVAVQACQLCALDVEEGCVTGRARHLEPGVGFGERGVDLSRRLKTLGLSAMRLQHMETVVANREWLAGAFSVADILMADVLRLVDRFDGLTKYPACRAYVARATARPAFVKPHADQLAHFAAADRLRAKN